MKLHPVLIAILAILALAACDHAHDNDHNHGNDHGHQHEPATDAEVDGQTQAFYGDDEVVVTDDLPEQDHGHEHGEDHEHDHNDDHGHRH